MLSREPSACRQYRSKNLSEQFRCQTKGYRACVSYIVRMTLDVLVETITIGIQWMHRAPLLEYFVSKQTN